MKWMAMEELPDIKDIKGILDRSFVFRFIIGDIDYNIKDITKNGRDAKFERLYEELIDLRKLLFAFRIIHYDDVIPDLKLNIKHRTEELCKPLLRDQAERLNFDPQTKINDAIKRVRDFRPISLDNLKMENKELYDLVSKRL